MQKLLHERSLEKLHDAHSEQLNMLNAFHKTELDESKSKWVIFRFSLPLHTKFDKLVKIDDGPGERDEKYFGNFLKCIFYWICTETEDYEKQLKQMEEKLKSRVS